MDMIAPKLGADETDVPSSKPVETKSKQAAADLSADAARVSVATPPATVIKAPAAAPARPTILPGKVGMMPVSNLNIQLGGGKNTAAKLKPQIAIRKSVIPAPQIVVTKANAVLAKPTGPGSSASPTEPTPKTAAPAAPAAPQAAKPATVN